MLGLVTRLVTGGVCLDVLSVSGGVGVCHLPESLE